MKQLFQQYLDNLEFRDLLELVAGHTTFEGGGRDVLSLSPVHDEEQLNRILTLVDEMVRFMDEDDPFHFGTLDPAPPVLRLLGVAGSVLEPAEILTLGDLIDQVVGTRSSLLGLEDLELLTETGRQLPDLGAARTFIRDRIDPSGEIPDRASPELAATRRSIRSLNEQIHRDYQQLLQKAAKGGILQDNYITIRNNRFVIPLKADSRRQLDGIVHGTSSSGLTAYVEPFGMVPLNNRFIGLRDRESEIVQMILIQVTDYLRALHEELEAAYDLLSRIDSLAARARFARRFRCIIPRLSTERFFLLEDGRHPLLESVLAPQGKEVVPASLELNPETPCLIISGPNTGGKTVALKTAGLLALMALSGIPVPARNMELCRFHHVFADIGDQQSLAEDLSTFSSHVILLKHMVDHYRHPSLLLIDEIGTGTDPEEGSALAMAVLEHFSRLSAPMVVTTHAQALKEYALTHDGVATAAVEIHPETLEPTYRLHHGTLGRSSGLFIARKLGLQEGIIHAANERLSGQSRLSDQVLERLNSLVHQRETEMAELTRMKHEHILRKIDLERRTEEKKREVIKQLRREFETAQKRFEDEKKKFFKELRRQALPEPRVDHMERRSEAFLQRARSEFPEDLGLEDKGRRRPVTTPLNEDEIHPELEVFISPMQCRGRVVDVADSGILVQAGDKRLRVPLRWLHRVPDSLAPPAPEPPSAPVINAAEEEAPVRELNIIGKTVDDALPEVERFLDTAFRQELRTVSIIHGMGRGVLRQAVQDYLRQVSFVRHFHHPPRHEGGEGKTVVELDV